MKYAIFIKTCGRDIDWIKPCLKSISKFVSSFDEIVIVAPEKDRNCFMALGLTAERLVFEHEPTNDGYTWQQVVKLYADTYTDADRILFVDSDCVFFIPVTPEYFLKNGKPYLLYTAYSELGQEVPWRGGSEFVIGKDVPYEFMRRHPMMYPRETLKAFRDYIENTFKMPCRDFVLKFANKKRLSEFNILGAFSFFIRHDDFVWYDTAQGLHPPDCLHQFWSYGGVDGVENKEKLAELSELLK